MEREKCYWRFPRLLNCRTIVNQRLTTDGRTAQGSAVRAVRSTRCSQATRIQTSSSSLRLRGCPLMRRESTSGNQAWSSTPISLVVSISVARRSRSVRRDRSRQNTCQSGQGGRSDGALATGRIGLAFSKRPRRSERPWANDIASASSPFWAMVRHGSSPSDQGSAAIVADQAARLGRAAADLRLLR